MFRRTLFVLALACTAAVPESPPSSSSYPHKTELPKPIPVFLKPSSSSRRKPSFYIPRMRDEQLPGYAFNPGPLGSAAPLFLITSPNCEYYALRLPLLKAGFRRLPASTKDVACNLIWGRSMPFREMQRLLDNGADSSGTAQRFVPPTSASMDGCPSTALQQQTAGCLDKVRMVNAVQQFNHFPLSHSNLGCKHGMAVNLRRAAAEMRRTGQNDRAVEDMYHFIPQTWFFPAEKQRLMTALSTAASGTQFIWKPARGSCGRGIFISQGGPRHAASWERIVKELEMRAACPTSGRLFRDYVVQEYIERPLLLEGRKMDLRLYVAVTSYDPLVVYLHEEGLVRIAAETYNGSSSGSQEPRTGGAEEVNQRREGKNALGRIDAASLPKEDRFRHLTNYSVGRHYGAHLQGVAAGICGSSEGLRSVAEASLTSSSAADARTMPPLRDGATPELKWDLQRLWRDIDTRFPTAAGAKVKTSRVVQERIALLITRTLMSVRGVISDATSAVGMPGGYFELYGFDVMLDTELRPFLIEVNTLPSLESSSTFDYATKTNVVSDLLNMAMIEPFARDVSDSDTLRQSEVFQGNLDVLPPSVRPFAYSTAEISQPLKNGRREESRPELLSRLCDELQYARGFQRIFPPSSTPSFSSSGDLRHLASSPPYQNDLRLYERSGFFTSRDTWALTG